MDTGNKEIVALAEELRPIHLNLHSKVAAIKKAAGSGQSFEAEQLATKELYPISEQVFGLVHKMEEVSNQAFLSFEEMNRLLLGEAQVHQKNTFQELDRIVEKAAEEASATVINGEQIAKTSNIITIIGIIVGIVLALVLGFISPLLLRNP